MVQRLTAVATMVARAALAILLLLCVISYAAFSFPLTVKDSTGVTHGFKNPPQKIVSGLPSITEMLFALDLGDKVVGVTQHCNYPPAAKNKPKIGRETINIEKVVSLKPDVIFMLEDAQRVDIERLRRFSLPVFTLNPHTLAEVKEDLLLLGRITGKEEKAGEVTAAMAQRLQKAADWVKAKKVKPKKVLVVVGWKPLVVAGPKTFIADMLKAASVINLAQDAKAPYPFYSFEELIRNPPEAIVVPADVIRQPSAIYGDEKWKGLRAVREKRVLFIPADLICRPGPRVAEAVEKIAYFVYNHP